MENKLLLFYDGSCGLCHRFVLFVLKHEEEPLFQFAPLQGETFLNHFNDTQASEFPDSLILLTEKGEVLKKLKAASINLDQIRLFECPCNDTWARDVGPLTVQTN